MKTKLILTGLISAIAFSGAVAQDIEHDDMYFNSSDRAKLKTVRQTENVVASNRRDRMVEDYNNPSDSYSARNTNPEYISRSQSQSARAEEDYYVTNYRSNQHDLNRWNNNFNSWYGSSWYRPNYWSPSVYGWNSPYSYYSPYDTWGNPYYRSGWGSSFSFYYGNSWWGNNYWDNYYGGYSPYYGYGYASSWNPYGGYGWGGYYPSRVVVINDDDRYSGTYGKRNSRSSQLGRDTDGSNRANGRIADGGRSDNSGGRLSDNSSRERRTEYYSNTWRNTSSSSGTLSSPSRSSFNNSSSSPSRSSWESQNRSRSSGSSFSSPSPSRSSFDSGSSNRSSGSSSSGSSSGSRSSRSRGGN